MIVTGRIGNIAADAGTISFDEPVHGLASVVLTRNTEIVAADGSPRDPRDLQTGMVIQVEGGPDGSGDVLATRVRIVSPS